MTRRTKPEARGNNSKWGDLQTLSQAKGVSFLSRFLKILAGVGLHEPPGPSRVTEDVRVNEWSIAESQVK